MRSFVGVTTSGEQPRSGGQGAPSLAFPRGIADSRAMDTTLLAGLIASGATLVGATLGVLGTASAHAHVNYPIAFDFPRV